MKKIDFETLANVALGHARTLIPDICPGGDMQGREYKCAGVTGSAGTSCSINMDTGKWADFATGEKGGDLISLWAAAYGVPMLDAYKQLAKHIGFAPGENRGVGMPKTKLPVEARMVAGVDEVPFNLAPIPETFKEPNFYHFKYKEATMVHTYRDADGRPLFYATRYDHKDGKEFIPYSWCLNRCELVPKAWPSMRPLYGLDLLAKAPADRAVLLVEGEKAAEAARKFVPEKAYTVLTWSGGSNAWAKTDWSPLFGRKILLWPDCDLKRFKTEDESRRIGMNIGDIMPEVLQPGFKAMMGIADILIEHCEVKYFSLQGHIGWGEIDGFDAADLLQQDIEWPYLKSVIVPLLKVYERKIVATKSDSQIQAVQGGEWCAGSHYDFYMQAGVGLNDKGKPISNMDNVKRIFEFHQKLKNKVWFDEFHTKIFTNWRTEKPVEWGEVDEMLLQSSFQRFLGLQKLSDRDLVSGVRAYAYENRKNEARDWMEALVWDGKPRIEEFLKDAFDAPLNPYSRAASGNFWRSMVARVYYPGCQSDNMLILEGKQGIKKSAALRLIGGDWYTEAPDSGIGKDFTMALQGKIIVEMAELSAFSQAETNSIKRIITVPTDRFRPPFARSVQSFPRTSVFVGTTNDQEYLKDFTGGRRYWPIRVRLVRIDYIGQNRGQLFAEAVHQYKHGAHWWDMPDIDTKQEQEERREKDEYEAIISEFLNTRTQTTIAQVAEIALNVDTKILDMRIQKRIGKILIVLGWDKKQIRVPGSTERRYVWEPVAHE